MLKSALKAQNAPLGLRSLGMPLCPPCPPAKGEKSLELWLLLQVEFPLTHSPPKPPPPSQGWDPGPSFCS